MADGLVILPDPPVLVDALGAPLREEPCQTFATEESAALTREAIESSLAALLPKPKPEPTFYWHRLGRHIPLGMSFVIKDVTDG